MSFAVFSTAASLLAALLLVREWRLLRERRMLAEDIELLCDTAMRCVQMYTREMPQAVHERLLPDMQEHVDPVNWDNESDISPVPGVDEIEDTIAYFSGNTRQATFAMMKRRGFDPDNDDHVVMWQNQMQSALN